MQKCCKNNFTICDDFVGCPGALLIRIPLFYTEGTVTIRIIKNGQVAQDVEGVVDEGGYVYIDAEDLPVGFLNPFGALYQIQFISDLNGSIIEFVIGGVVYDSIEISVIQGQAVDDTFIIDIFS